MNHIAIVPARAGSKGIPGKNLKVLGGLSLVHRALKSALDTGFMEKVVLSTDIPVLIEEERVRWTIRNRPTELCEDKTPMCSVVLDVLEAYSIPDDWLVWLLQPTAPFRVTQDFTMIRNLFEGDKIRSVISVTPVGDRHPSRFYTMSREGDLRPIDGRAARSTFTNRQDLKPAFERNGLFYTAKAGDLRKSGGLFYIERCRAFVIEKQRGMHNINDEIDLRIAKTEAQWI